MTYYEAYSKCKNVDELFDMVDNDRAFAGYDDADELNCILDAALTVIAEHRADTLAWPYGVYDLSEEGE